eukprot:scaffold472941_cov23-Prasinocladus_malaysianus.AAC.1
MQRAREAQGDVNGLHLQVLQWVDDLEMEAHLLDHNTDTLRLYRFTNALTVIYHGPKILLNQRHQNKKNRLHLRTESGSGMYAQMY